MAAGGGNADPLRIPPGTSRCNYRGDINTAASRISTYGAGAAAALPHTGGTGSCEAARLRGYTG
jgi:hypothetical protein